MISEKNNGTKTGQIDSQNKGGKKNSRQKLANYIELGGIKERGDEASFNKRR